MDNAGKQSSVIGCSDSSAVFGCKVPQIETGCVTSVFDTGSQASLVRSCLLPSDICIKPKLRSVNDRALSVKGCVTLCIELQALLCEHEFVVVDDDSLDFVSTNSMKLEFALGALRKSNVCTCSVQYERDDSETDEEFYLTSVGHGGV